MLRIAYRVFPLDSTRTGTPQSDSFWLPVIPIRLVLGDRAVRVEGIVDSGSHCCLFHWDVGELLGLDVGGGVRDTVSGALRSTQSEVFYHRLRMDVGSERLSVRAGFTRDALQPGLLGRDGFFDQFRVTFNPETTPAGMEIERVRKV